MADTHIEWTDKVWNVTRGCRRVSPGCGGPGNAGGCYAERQAIRMSNPGGAYEGLVQLTPKGPRWTGKGRFATEKLAEPLRWREPKKVFVDSMSDLFFEEFTDEQIAAVFGVMAACPQHTFQVLTKRPERAAEWFADCGEGSPLDRCACAADDALDQLLPRRTRALAFATGRGAISWPLPNVWLGTSVEDQQRADERIPHLLRCPAAVRFLSYEPALGPLRLPDDAAGLIHWGIVGSESGPGARPMDLAWVRAFVGDCHKIGASPFVKQIANERDKKGGDPKFWPAGNWPREWPEVRE